MPNHFLAIYLNDHFAGATAGVELARRVRASNRDSAEFRAPLEQICTEIEADRQTLERVMERLAIRRDPVKAKAAWLAEKLGRLKLNGRFRGYSPLSRLVELEGLCLGISGKIELWRALDEMLDQEWDDIDFGRLRDHAERQRATVEELQLKAAATTFSAF